MRLVIVTVLAFLAAFAAGTAPKARAQEATPGAAVIPDDVITMVMWYEFDSAGNKLVLRDLQTEDNQIVIGSRQADGEVIGDAIFDLAAFKATITVGDSVFEAYPLYPGDPDSTYQWRWFNDEFNRRPATLVMQIDVVSGPYAAASVDGTATFVSRSGGDDAEQFASGVVVILLRPA